MFGGCSWFVGDGNVLMINCSMMGFIVGVDMVFNDKWCVGLVVGVMYSLFDND